MSHRAGDWLGIDCYGSSPPVLQRRDSRRDWAWPARWVGLAFILILVADVATSSLGFGGLMERVLAALGAAAIGALAWRISIRSEPQSTAMPEPGL
jgi:hypothetical protein